MYLFDTLQGCVYVKCDTHHSAGLAFRSLHGCWFDGKSICCSALFKKQTYGEQIVSGTWLCTRGIFSQPTFSPCFCYSGWTWPLWGGEIHDIRFAIFRSKILWPIKNCQVLGTAIFTPIPWKTPWILFALSCTNPGQMNHDVLQHFCCSTVAPRCRINLYFLQGLMQRKRFKSPSFQVVQWYLGVTPHKTNLCLLLEVFVITSILQVESANFCPASLSGGQLHF